MKNDNGFNPGVLRISLLVVVINFLSISQFIHAQDLPYSSGSTGEDGALSYPPVIGSARRFHEMVYDAERQQIVMFGGRRFSNDFGSETWVWNGETGATITPNTIPRPRLWFAMAYDSDRRETIMFGGNTNAVSRAADTWKWNGTNWELLRPENNPEGRRFHAMAYDAARQQVVLYGADGAGSGETWIWNGTNWVLLSPLNSPSGRSHFKMVFDSVREKIVLFGGWNNSNVELGDTWVWDGVNWEEKGPTTSPTVRRDYAMAYDPIRENVVLFGGRNAFSELLDETWIWDGTNWTLASPVNSPSARHWHAMAFNEVLGKVVLFGGSELLDFSDSNGEIWLWDGSNWELFSQQNVVFNMNDKTDGVWNFTSIHIPQGVVVDFLPNAGNAPVQWLATENVQIDGTLNLNGKDGTGIPDPGNEALGGPGGFAGGLGGIRFDQSGSYTGNPGLGPGGGLPGIEINTGGGGGGYLTIGGGGEGLGGEPYGNAFIQPLIGGSGGGGGASSDTLNGGNGGGGGGAILIASSKDIAVNGSITANGGRGFDSRRGSAGSGGAVRLIADRITGSGSVSAIGGPRWWNGSNGRIRLEAFFRDFRTTGSTDPVGSYTAPIVTQNFDSFSLAVVDIAGENVAQPPTGDPKNPDVIFTESGEVAITVQATNIPDNTPVTLKVVTSEGLILLPREGESDVLLNEGLATFNVSVPAGIGTIQALTEFTVSGN